MSYPPVAFPSTSNILSSQDRAARVRTSKKLSRVLGDVPRVLDDESSRTPARVSSLSTPLGATGTESIWRKRKPTHLPPLLKLSPSPSPFPSPVDGPASPYLHRSSVLSVAPSIISNAPSTASGSSADVASDASSQRRTKLDRLRRKLGDEVPATVVFPTTPRTAVPRTPKTAATPATPKRSPRGRTRSIARRSVHADDAHSVTFSISSDESVHTVSLRVHSPHSSRQKHVYQTGPLPPVPPIPARFAPSASRDDEEGLVRPRTKMAVGSRFGGADFKAARRAKREGKMGELGETVEMVGFM